MGDNSVRSAPKLQIINEIRVYACYQSQQAYIVKCLMGREMSAEGEKNVAPTGRLMPQLCMYFQDYSVADSMRFMLANMNTPATMQMARRTTQIVQRGILIQRRPGTDTR